MAAAVVGTVESNGDRNVWSGIAGANDNDLVIETNDVSRLDTYQVSCTSGSFDVFVNDGNQWLTSPLSLADLGAVTVDPVVVGTGLRNYGFRGFYAAIRVRQTLAVALLGATLRGYRSP